MKASDRPKQLAMDGTATPPPRIPAGIWLLQLALLSWGALTSGGAIRGVAALATPTPLSWASIEYGLSLPSLTASLPSSIDSVLDPARPTFSQTRPTLFRERHGWCPYSERVWLCLEIKGIQYDEVRIDNTGGGKPSYFGGLTPQLRWPDGRTQGESMDLVRDLDSEYSDQGPRLYPDGDDSDLVEDRVNKFRSTFPSKARPSSRAAFLFGYGGEPLWKSEFERVLEETDKLLSEARGGGPFFCGSEVTAADVAWTPFLERYGAQLPCLHEGLDPRDVDAYPHLARWYHAMEDAVPAYACRVMGDRSSWRKVLRMAGFGNGGLPPQIEDNFEEESYSEGAPLTAEEEARQLRLWGEYAKLRPHVAETPAAEAAAVLARNRDAILADIRGRASSSSKWIERGLPVEDADAMDLAMRGLASALMGEDADAIHGVPGAAALAGYLDERMCVPRDMGALSAAAIKRLAAVGV